MQFEFVRLLYSVGFSLISYLGLMFQRSLQSELCRSPSLVVPDLTKFNSPAILHLGMLALDRFHELRGVMPKVW